MKFSKTHFWSLLLLSFYQISFSQILYNNAHYKIFADSVVQNKFKSVVKSAMVMESNYEGLSMNLKEPIRTRTLGNDALCLPSFSSRINICDIMYKLSMEESYQNVRKIDGAFMAGEWWPDTWTRDVSYGIILAIAISNPEASKITLLAKSRDGKIIQDTGTGGSWPVSTDRVVWVLAAWEIYKVTGDLKWLNTIYPIIKNSILVDDKNVKHSSTLLMKGESSFLDWRTQSFPEYFSPDDVSQAQCLGTNVLHLESLKILNEIEAILKPKVNNQVFLQSRISELQKAINQNFWSDENGYYSQYLYGDLFPLLSPRYDGLGNALAVLCNVSDTKQTAQILKNKPNYPFGTPTLYPQSNTLAPYHNESNWPFIEAFQAWISAREGQISQTSASIASLYRQASLFLTNRENMILNTGGLGTVINSGRQFWSVAGNLAITYRVFLGLNFQTNGILFAPTIPQNFASSKILKGFKYRNAELDIVVEGFGNKVKQTFLDGKLLEKPFIGSNLKGKHEVKIVLENQSNEKEVVFSEQKFALNTPQFYLKNDKIEWSPVIGADEYEIWLDGKFYAKTIENQYFTHNFKPNSIINLKATSSKYPESYFTSAVIFKPQTDTVDTGIETEYKGFKGKGYTSTSGEKNTKISFEWNCKQKGKYAINLRYSNGNGSNSQDNKCAIRSLLVNGIKKGTFVLTQRGEKWAQSTVIRENWETWGLSNYLIVEMDAGKNNFNIDFLNEDANMNKEKINEAFIDQLYVTKLNN